MFRLMDLLKWCAAAPILLLVILLLSYPLRLLQEVIQQGWPG